MGREHAVPLAPDAAAVPQLHERLRDLIVSCELHPGQRISETEIAEAYHVSRQPVREAFIKLAERQLVDIRPQRGTFICRISASAALTARFIREAVEADLVRRVAQQATPEMIANLDANLDAQENAAQKGDPAAFMLLDQAFHKLLATFADAVAVSEYLDDLNIQLNRVRNISARQFSPQHLISQHREIVEAIRKGAQEEAEGAMRRHLREFNRDLPKIIRANPDYFDETEDLV